MEIDWTLEQVKDFLSFFARHSENVYWLSTAQFEQIKYVSPSYEKVWGRSRTEIYRDPEIWINFLHPEDARNHHPIHEAKKQIQKISSNMRFEADYRIIKPGGEVRWIMDRGFPIVDLNGECIGVTGIAVDVTEKKLLLEQIKSKNSELTKVISKYQEFVSNQEHDIRTPISCVVGLSEALIDLLTEPEHLELARYINESAKAQKAYQNSLLDGIYLFEKETEPYPRRFELKSIIDEVKSIYACAFKESQLNAEIIFDDALPRYLWGDWFRLQQILVCLLSNSVKFTEPGDNIFIRCKGIFKREREIILSIEIEDTGIGIENDKLDAVFEPFNRLSLSNLGKYAGRGLGLTFVKKMVMELHGEINVTSIVGKGSVFHVLIPFERSLSDEPTSKPRGRG